MAVDVTALVDFGYNDDESLPLTKCVCGALFNLWGETLSVYENNPWVCPHCGAKLFFTVGIRVWKTE